MTDSNTNNTVALSYQHAQFLLSAPSCQHLPSNLGREVVFVGRSNAGKSSVINTLTHKGLARTSKTPGRTRMFTVFTLPHHPYQASQALSSIYRLIDLPGYGFAHAAPDVQRRWGREWFRNLTTRKDLCGVILILDIRHPPNLLDVTVFRRCLSHEKPVHIVLTKADKLSRSRVKEAFSEIKEKLCQYYPIPDAEEEKSAAYLCTLQMFSSVTRQGVEALRSHVDDFFSLDPDLPRR